MISHKELSPQTKVWVYQADKELSDVQVELFSKLSEVFAEHWESHGKPVKGTLELFYKRFIVVFIDESDEQACGRCVDSSVRFMKELEEELHVKLLDRMLVAYRSKNEIRSCTLSEFKQLIAGKQVNAETLVFNNTVHSLPEFEKLWEVPLKDSWHKRLLEEVKS